jgi:hypothetical protein
MQHKELEYYLDILENGYKSPSIKTTTEEIEKKEFANVHPFKI